jgi:hypothetical protein
LKVNQCFGGTYCLHLQNWRLSRTRNQHEAGSKQSLLYAGFFMVVLLQTDGITSHRIELFITTDVRPLNSVFIRIVYLFLIIHWVRYILSCGSKYTWFWVGNWVYSSFELSCVGSKALSSQTSLLEQSSSLLLAFISMVILGFWPCWDPWLYFILSWWAHGLSVYHSVVDWWGNSDSSVPPLLWLVVWVLVFPSPSKWTLLWHFCEFKILKFLGFGCHVAVLFKFYMQDWLYNLFYF